MILNVKILECDYLHLCALNEETCFTYGILFGRLFFFRFSTYVQEYFLNRTTLDLRKEKWSFLNRDLPLLNLIETLESEP